ncbi:MAG: hypothetical protein ACK53Y_27700 [bacterium]
MALLLVCALPSEASQQLLHSRTTSTCRTDQRIKPIIMPVQMYPQPNLSCLPLFVHKKVMLSQVHHGQEMTFNSLSQLSTQLYNSYVRHKCA